VGIINTIQWAQPYLLLLLLPMLALPIWWLGARHKSKGGLQLNFFPQYAPRATWRAKLAPLPKWLYWLAALSMIIALAQPQLHNRLQYSEGDGVDIMLSIDISGSMLADDFSPNRLEVVKSVAADFINARPFDRIGVAAFGKESFTYCPLTTDKNILQAQVKNLRAGDLGTGTAIGLGLATAIKRLQQSNAKSKVIILLTDGENNEGQIDPKTAADIAVTYGIKVYTIGVGSYGMANVPYALDAFGEFIFRQEPVKIDETLLKYIATLTGGLYHRVASKTQLSEVYNKINALEKSKIQVNNQIYTTELFMPLLKMALLLILIAFALDKIIIRALVS
jgi:Ca-activated chloride channel homolog